MKNRNARLFFLLLFLLDTGYSFVQHFHATLDGDMAGIILPAEPYRHVLSDPFGLDVLLKNERYAAPNRFFAHVSMSAYFKSVPFWLQHFVSPVQSVYLACAFAKTTIQVLLILLLALYITATFGSQKIEYPFVVVLITPFFQTSGYNIYMGIIDKSITYTFFYSLPVMLLLLFFLPFYKAEFFGKPVRFNAVLKILWFILAVVISFNGPLIPGLVLIVCPLALIIKWKRAFKELPETSFRQRLRASFNTIPRLILFYFLLVIGLCAYSFFIGTHNSENDVVVPLLDRFSRLPEGLLNPFTRKLGFPLLALVIVANVFLLLKNKHNETGQKILMMIKWMVLFILLYMALLPFGGYREYRPNILRHDTLLPLTICMICMYCLSSYWIIQQGSRKVIKIYSIVIAGVFLIFTNADRMNLNENECEKEALYQIARSSDQFVPLKNDCLVMEWHKVTKYRDSELNSRLLQLWGITKERKWYCQDIPESPVK
jgi:hypothetical protein